MSNREISITVTGWVADDPRNGKCDNGSSHVSFRVIHNGRYRKADGSWKEREAIGMTVRCFGAQADNVKSSIRKGMPVVVSGRLQCSTWIDKDTAKKRSILEVIAHTVGPDLSLGECVFRRVKPAVKEQNDTALESTSGLENNMLDDFLNDDPDVWQLVPEDIKESSLEAVLSQAKTKAEKAQNKQLNQELLSDNALVA